MSNDTRPCWVVGEQRQLWWWWVTGSLGTIIALMSSIFNGFALFALMFNFHGRRQSSPSTSGSHSAVAYLKPLIATDIIVCICYIPLITLDRIRQIFDYQRLAIAYWIYFVPVLTIAHVAKTTSAYLILAMTFERMAVSGRMLATMALIRRRRPPIVISCLVLSLLIKGPILFELTVSLTIRNLLIFRVVGIVLLLLLFQWTSVSGCSDGIQWKRLSPTALVQSNPIYSTYFLFYFRNITSIFLPFVLIAAFNCVILASLKRKKRRADLYRFSGVEHKVRLIAVTMDTNRLILV